MTDRFTRVSAAATVVVIGAIAAYISYMHALDVATDHGETGTTGKLLPLTIDGLVYVASMVLLDAARRGVPAPALARLALTLGIGATVAVNVLHGVEHGVIGALIAAWPAVTLVVAVELLMGMIRRGQDENPSLDESTFAGQGVSEPLDIPDGYARWDEIEPARETLVTALPEKSHDVTNRKSHDATNPDLAPVIATARDRFAETLATGAVPSVRALRRELHIGHPRAVRVRQALEAESALATA